MKITMNKQALHQRLCEITKTTEEYEEQVEQLQQKLNKLSEWIFEREHEILPIQKDDTLKHLSPIFTLSQVEDTQQQQGKISSAAAPSIAVSVICPHASLPSWHTVKSGESYTVGFRCYCEDSDHAPLLEYQWNRKSLLLKEMSFGQTWTWNIVLFKHSKRVHVRLTNVKHDESGEIECFAQRLATSLAQVVFSGSRHSEFSPLANIDVDTVNVLRCVSDLSFPAKRLLSIELKTKNRVIKRLKSSETLRQILYYDCGLRSLYEDNESLVASEYSFMSAPYFDLITTASTSTGNSLNKIQIYHHTIISPIRDPFMVEINQVSYSTEKITIHCDSIIFCFTHKAAADVFRESIQNMQLEVRKRFVCSILSGESRVYYQDTNTHPLTKFLLVFDPKRSRYRIIVARDKNPRSICFDVGKEFLDDPDYVYHDYIAKSPVWRLERISSGDFTLEKLLWHQLFDQGKPKLRAMMRVAGGTMLSRPNETSSEVWMEEFGELIEVLEPKKYLKEIDDEYKPVRIAVLDTGIDKNHRLVLKKKIFYRDFVDNQDKIPRDDSGHGTNSVELVLKGYVNAELFVGRIFANDTSDEETGPKLMADGIDWARKNHVNIISISAGFKGTSEGGCPLVLRTAVEEAAGKGILIFAAASNWGNKDRIPYPAALADHVMCIFATNGANRNLRDLNPDPRPHAHNFAILGSDVKVIEGKTKETGTSIATALAAGLAGMLIDFSRHLDSREAIANRALVEKKAGMTAVFKKMSLGDVERYDCVIPKKFMPDDIARGERAEKRAYVRKKLTSALKKAN